MMLNWTQILENLGVFGLLTGAIAWLLKTLGQNIINKRFKAFEKELDIKSQEYQASLNVGLETHKAKLNIEHTQYAKLHEKRLSVMSELYERLSDLDAAMHILTAPMKFSQPNQTAEEQDHEHMVAGRDTYIKFRDYYNKNKICFSESNCVLIDDLIKEYTATLFDGTARQRMGKSNVQFNYDSQAKAIETLHTKIPPIKQKLEKEFRDTLGVK